MHTPGICTGSAVPKIRSLVRPRSVLAVVIVLLSAVVMTIVPVPVVSADGRWDARMNLADSLVNAHAYNSTIWRALLDSADTLAGRRQQDTAITLGVLALSMAEAELGPEDTAVAGVLHRLGNYHFFKQDYSAADTLHQRALDIRQKVLGSDHPHVAYSLTSLAVIYRRLGRYAEAEPLQERALAIWEDEYGPNHELTAWVLNNLTTLCEQQRKLSQAEAYCRRALTIWESVQGSESHNVSVCLSTLAALRRLQGNYAAAESLQVQALTIREKIYGPEDVWVAETMNELADLYQVQGRTAEAVSLAGRALAIAEKNLEPDHPSVAGYLHNLADLYCDQGRFKEARPMLERALNLKMSVLGSDHRDVADIERTYSRYLRWHGDTALALQIAEQACRTMHRTFADNAMVLSEKDALNFSQLLRSSSDNFMSCYADLGSLDPEVTKAAADLILATKGCVSDGMYERQKALVQENDAPTIAAAAALKTAKLQISRRYVMGPGDDAGRFRDDLDSLVDLVNELETSLSRLSASFRQTRRIRECDINSVRSSLPKSACLVEYLMYGYLDTQSNRAAPRYLALVISESADPVVLDIGPSAPVDRLINSYRRHMLQAPLAGLPSHREVSDYRSLASELYSKVWKPVEKFASEKELVLVAPDGGLNLISFAGLVDDEGAYLIEKYPIHYLSAGRDLVRLKEDFVPAVGLLALGDPDYDASVSERVSGIESEADTIVSFQHSSIQAARMGSDDFRGMKVSSIPWTRREVNRIAEAWSNAWHESSKVLCGADASEDRLKVEAHCKRVIHLATHGYFLKDQSLSENKAGATGSAYGPELRNPLLRSGLFLAGANRRDQIGDSSKVDDGVLTAFEVSAMNLQGTQWVVLSACESGLGEVKAGEGVWGLRRAFQMAGARTVISALWPIPDKQTVSIMTQIYASSSDDLAQVMRKVALSEIEKARRLGRPEHPYSWAAFIAVGEWRARPSAKD